MFYVYEWYNIITNEIFYVGKGCKDRYKQISKRNKKFQQYYKNNSCDVRIIKEFELQEDAFKYEHQRILELKNKNQCSCNLDYGGKGGVNFIWTPEMREYQSKYNPMKSIEQRERMKQHNPMKNPQIAKKVGAKHAKAVIINGIFYSSLVEASKALNVSDVTIGNWCKKGYNSKGQLCSYINQKNKNQKEGQYVFYKGEIYISKAVLALKVKKSPSTIANWCKKGYDSNFNECRLATQEEIQAYKNKQANQQPS